MADTLTPAGAVDQEGLLQELAGLSGIQYDRRREAAAKTLGVRVQTLDAEVALRRPQPEEPGAEETPGTKRRGVPRGTLRPLDPAPTVALPDGWSLLASEACRSNHGLRLTVYGVNGAARLAQTVSPGDPASVHEAVSALGAVSGLDVTLLRGALASLAYSAEGVLRDMEARRAQEDKAESLPGSAVLFEDLQPWPAPVDGAALLTELAETFAQYVVLPPGSADFLALWVLHSYALDAAQVTPILALVSPLKRCGKTTCLSVLQALVSRPLPGSNLTPAVVFRAIEALHPTLIVDEADTFMRDNDALRGVLNSGHSRSMAFVLRMIPVGDGFEPRQFSTWCPKAIAGIGTLPDTLNDRSIVVPLQRKTREEKVGRWREAHRQDLLPLRQQCLGWAQQHLDALRLAEPTVPEGLHDRGADNWASLLAIADQAGGEWPDKARQAVAALEGLRPEEDAAAITLLRDIQDIFAAQKGQPDADKLPTKTLLERLRSMEERPWPEWGRTRKPISDRQVAKLLETFRIRSKTIRLPGDDTPKGYELAAFHDAFAHYLGSPSATPPQVNNSADLRAISIRHKDASVADGKTRNPAPDNGCGGVADGTGGSREVLRSSAEVESLDPPKMRGAPSFWEEEI